jgi:hypothetical protein
LRDGTIAFSESKRQFAREKRIEGKYVIATSEKALSVPDAVAMYKDLIVSSSASLVSRGRSWIWYTLLILTQVAKTTDHYPGALA